MFQIIIDSVKDFLKFLIEKNIVNTGIAFILAFQINKLFLIFVDDIAAPIAERILSEKVNKVTTEVGGINFKTGDFIFALFRFFVILVCIYYMIKVSETTPGFFGNIYSKIKSIF